ncbi:GlsB/YeaQ/YmgE family stress response membrane protein [Candidatus Pacebacteria bacterium]|nr:GlsB/YeaQ/YmgE family stress response membrane protein [Candidatus Paceibacterota bacterium]
MGILTWIIVGGVAGWLGSIIMKTNASMGLLMNIIVGIVGAFLGGFIFSFFGAGGFSGFNLYSLLVATVGAVATIWIYGMVTRHA